MPFTLAHPAAVLPLRRSGLPMAALVCGSMAPDLHMLVPGVRQTQTHSLVGLPTIDVLLAMALFAGWSVVGAFVVDAAAPAAARARWPRPRVPTGREWALAVPAAFLGAVTHLGWDVFTHWGMWGWRHIAWLREPQAGVPGYMWMQYAGSVLGLVILAGWGLRAWSHAPARAVAEHPRAASARAAVGVPLGAGLAFGALLLALMLVNGVAGLDALMSVTVRGALLVSVVLGSLGAVAWWAAGRRHPGGARPARDS